MKRFFSIFTLIFFIAVSSPDAQARKFGGGKSFGKSYKTAPAPKSTPAKTDSVSKQNAPASSKPSMAKGIMGGMLGGLLMGGLIASLFGGSFEGFQMMDFLIIALLAFALFKIFKALLAMKRKGEIPSANKQAYFGAPEHPTQKKDYFHAQPASPPSSHADFFGAGKTEDEQSVPMNFASNFDSAAFIEGARDHYRILQEAWNENKLETIQEYVTPQLYNDLSKERRTLEGAQHTEVMYVDAQIVRADFDLNRAQLSVQFTGRYRDTHEGKEEDITDIWHLERDVRQENSPWLIVGIQA